MLAAGKSGATRGGLLLPLFLKALVFFPLLLLLPLLLLVLGAPLLLPAPLLLLLLLRSTGIGVAGLAGGPTFPLPAAAPFPPPRCCFTLLLGVTGHGTGRAYTLPDRM